MPRRKADADAAAPGAGEAAAAAAPAPAKKRQRKPTPKAQAQKPQAKAAPQPRPPQRQQQRQQQQQQQQQPRGYVNYDKVPPPATINMNTSKPEEPLGDKWLAKDAGKKAVLGITNQARLAGTVTVAVQVAPAVLLGLVAAKDVPSVVKMSKNPDREMAVAWEATTGEFSSPQGQLPLSRLLVAMDKGQVTVPSKDSKKVLEQLWSLQNPLSSPWKRPLLRLCTTLDPPPGALPKAKTAGEVEVRLTFHVYLGRLIFELVADPDIQGVMAALTPAGPVRPTAKLPPSTPMFNRSPAPASAAAAAKSPASSGQLKKKQEVVELLSDGEEVLCIGDDDDDDEVEYVPPPPTSAKRKGGKGKGKQKATTPPPPHNDCRHYDFTLPGILHAAESTDYPIRDPQPPGLSVSLFDFQRSTLQWMLDRERGPGLNDFFWERWAWRDAMSEEDGFYYFPAAGELRLHKPPHRTGGLLAEEMGLGKTVECLGLILANPLPRQVPPPRAEEVPSAYPATLIVVPSTLLSQWVVEIHKTTHPGAVNTTVFVGNVQVRKHLHELRYVAPEGSRSWCGACPEPTDHIPVGTMVWAPVCLLDEEEQSPAAQAAEEDEAKQRRARQQYHQASVIKRVGQDMAEIQFAYERTKLGQADVVMTTYDTLRHTAGSHFLKQVPWHRIILDECQEIRSSTSAIAKLCASLQANHRWMVSGTPLFSSIDDLHGELQFLAVSPFSLAQDGFWETRIANPFKRRTMMSLKLLRLLISVCMMRHSKGQTYVSDGRPLVTMPQRTISWMPVDALTPSERFCYAYLEVLASKECTRLVEQALMAAAASAAAADAAAAAAAAAAATANEEAEEEGGGGGATTANSAASPQRVLTREEQDRVLKRAMEWRGGGRGRADVGAHAKLKALLFMLQRVLLHPSLVALPQLDTIKRSLQIQQRLLSISSAFSSENQIPKLRIDDILLRLQGRNATGGLMRDVNRTWALHGVVEARDKLEALSLQELRHMVEAEGVPLPIAWFQLPVRAAIFRGSVSMKLKIHYDDEEEKGGSGAGSSSQQHHRKRLSELLAVGNVIRIGTNDEDNEQVIHHLELMGADEQEGHAALERPWGNESKQKTLVFKKGPATRRKMYVDLLLAKEQEQKGQTAELHEAGFAALFAALEGQDLNCPICLCTVGEPTVTQCCHVYCKTCILAQLEEAQRSQHGNASSRCAVCRKPVSQQSLMQLDTSSIERYQEQEDEEQREDGEETKEGEGQAVASQDSVQVSSGPKDDDGGGKMSAEELQAAEAAEAAARNGTASSSFSPPASSSPAAAGAAAATTGPSAYGALSLPHVGFPPAADEDVLKAIPEPFAHVRDPRTPSLDPAFLAHHHNCHRVLSSKVKTLLVDMRETLGRDASSKFVVFSQFGDAIDAAAAMLQDQGLACVTISSHTERTQRQRAVASFSNNPTIKVILVTTGLGSAGLTLTAASTLYMLEPCHSMGDEAQAMSRVHRIGTCVCMCVCVCYLFSLCFFRMQCIHLTLTLALTSTLKLTLALT